MSKKWMALVAMTALIGGVASVGCSSDDADNTPADKTDAGPGDEGTGGSGGSDEPGETDGGTGGTGGQGGSGGGGQSCGSLADEWSSDAACNSCMEDMCCDELADCDEGTDCGNLLDCLLACGKDEACQEACVDEHGGLGDLQALFGCADECDDECNSGAVCDSGWQLTPPECGDCLGANCCEEFSDCMNADEECSRCFQGKTTADDDCDENEALDNLATCQKDSCAIECPIANAICDSPFSWGDSSDEKAVACAACQGEKCCDIIKECGESQLCSDCLTGAKKGADCDSVKATVDEANACRAPGGACADACK